MGATEILARLREESSSVVQVLDLYKETVRIYQDALTAMGRIPRIISESRNSAEVTVSLPPSRSFSTDEWGP